MFFFICLHSKLIENFSFIRLQQLEKKVYIEHGDVPSEFSQLKDEVNAFKDKLEVRAFGGYLCAT